MDHLFGRIRKVVSYPPSKICYSCLLISYMMSQEVGNGGAFGETFAQMDMTTRLLLTPTERRWHPVGQQVAFQSMVKKQRMSYAIILCLALQRPSIAEDSYS